MKCAHRPDASELDPSKWDAWSPKEVATLLAPVEAPWYVAGGWAIDLFLGGQTREHADIEIAVPREPAVEVFKALDGYELCPVGSHQTWVREPATGAWKLDVTLEPSAGRTWVFRRDERIRMPLAQAIERTADGVPYGCPEIVLLFKAKHAREKDDADFTTVLPHLAPQRRRWLADALALVHPCHRWLRALQAKG
jgi:Aminoglycoside-2''-adenylyltransferase